MSATSPVPAPGSSHGPPRLVRRPNLSARVNGGLMILVGLAMCGILMRMVIAFQGPAGAGPFLPLFSLIRVVGTLIGLTTVVAGVVPLRQRTVFDSAGIHSRGLLRTRHLPWPGSRAAFVVDVSVRRSHTSTSRTGVPHHGVATVVGRVEVSADGHRTVLAAPRVSASGSQGVRDRLEAEVDEIWAWAEANGYVYGVVPGAGAYVAPGPVVGAVAGTEAGGPGSAQADPSLVSQEPLVLRRRLVTWLPRTVLVVVFYAVVGWLASSLILPRLQEAQGFPASSSAASSVDPSVGSVWPQGSLLESLLVAVPLLLAATQLFHAYRSACTRLTVTREGLTHFDGLRTRWLDWPTSRSSIFVTLRASEGRTTAAVGVVAAGGSSAALPALTWRARDERQALWCALEAAETIWMWGTSRGVVHDDGVYRPLADAEAEQARVRSTERIEYLLRGAR